MFLMLTDVVVMQVWTMQADVSTTSGNERRAGGRGKVDQQYMYMC